MWQQCNILLYYEIIGVYKAEFTYQTNKHYTMYTVPYSLSRNQVLYSKYNVYKHWSSCILLNDVMEVYGAPVSNCPTFTEVLALPILRCHLKKDKPCSPKSFNYF